MAKNKLSFTLDEDDKIKGVFGSSNRRTARNQIKSFLFLEEPSENFSETVILLCFHTTGSLNVEKQYFL